MFAYYATVAWEDPDCALYSGALGSIPDLADRSARGFTPSNIWPADRSWLVYTDYDLQGTKVSGTAALIEDLRGDPGLEVITWHEPAS